MLTALGSGSGVEIGTHSSRSVALYRHIEKNLAVFYYILKTNNLRFGNVLMEIHPHTQKDMYCIYKYI